jgi:hypothetical protein
MESNVSWNRRTEDASLGCRRSLSLTRTDAAKILTATDGFAHGDIAAVLRRAKHECLDKPAPKVPAGP